MQGRGRCGLIVTGDFRKKEKRKKKEEKIEKKRQQERKKGKKRETLQNCFKCQLVCRSSSCRIIRLTAVRGLRICCVGL
jgi:hypothetical protein